AEKDRPRATLARVLSALRDASFVHGDLPDVNIIVHIKADGTLLGEAGKVQLRIIDFDRSWESGKVDYLPSRNPGIDWPGKIIDKIILEHDKILVDSVLRGIDIYQ
ncbi:hypothetical protein FRB91_008684, partial [Serendipita sp. 411]